jgi:uncharacterized membrane protein YjjP (DUF1212 family)
MKDFLENVLRYPKFLVLITAGVLSVALTPLVDLWRRPITAIALVIGSISSLVGLSLVLRAMLGLDPIF